MFDERGFKIFDPETIKDTSLKNFGERFKNKKVEFAWLKIH